ncbi:hypothetical protein V5799_032258 [Amblyomma americanum]|uniref:Uncharacterized protein n=1 Tax=Amblyomma americanum TaxID=6943 RepID=A0AAQ4DRN7_AMBAM
MLGKFQRWRCVCVTSSLQAAGSYDASFMRFSKAAPLGSKGLGRAPSPPRPLAVKAVHLCRVAAHLTPLDIRTRFSKAFAVPV